jgi:hypothetical protein
MRKEEEEEDKNKISRCERALEDMYAKHDNDTRAGSQEQGKVKCQVRSGQVQVHKLPVARSWLGLAWLVAGTSRRSSLSQGNSSALTTGPLVIAAIV